MSDLAIKLRASTTKPHGLQKLGENLARSKSRSQARQELATLADSPDEALRLATEECREWFEAVCEHRDIVGGVGFAVGGVGYGGQFPWTYLAFLRKLALKNADQYFERDLHHSAKIYQLYSLLGLSETNPLTFQKALPHFLNNSSRIYTQSGCVATQRPVSEVASEIAKGSYHEAITQGKKRVIFTHLKTKKPNV
jgi:hypothetical protein